MELVELAADFADGSEWVTAGYSSPGRWIAAMVDVTQRAANEWIRIGRALRNLPEVRAAVASGAISFAKARVLTRTAGADTEAELVDLAQRVPAGDLGAALAAWSRRNEPDSVIDERQRSARSVHHRTDPNGMIVTTLRYPPIEGATITAAIDAVVSRRAGRGLTGKEARWPSLAQQRADALFELVTAGGAGVDTEIVVHLRGDGNALDDGTPVDDHAVAGLLPASLIRALIHDADGRPINASARRRYPTMRQRRVVKERDRACVDCNSHDLLEYDHVPDFAETGHTVVDELQLRCGP